MSIGVSLDQARIDCKTFAPTRPAAMQVPPTRSNTRRKTSLTEALVAAARERLCESLRETKYC
jgi:hypothetical protein